MDEVADNHIRPFRPLDSAALAEIHNLACQPDSISPDRLRIRLVNSLDTGGRVWVIMSGGKPAGYAFINPVPGLKNVYDLRGCITPGLQRRGLGSQLLQHILGDLQTGLISSDDCQVEHAVGSLDSPAARFLARHGFIVGHEESNLMLVNLDDLPWEKLPPEYSVRTLDQARAIRTFLDLYEEAFSGLPWYQPYRSEGEVAAELEDPADILFLFDDSMPIGFLWTRWPTVTDAEIEPLGILPVYRGRGLGRLLLLAGLRWLAAQGAGRVRIGAWSDNRPAIALYQSLGFHHDHVLTYLAYIVKRF